LPLALPSRKTAGLVTLRASGVNAAANTASYGFNLSRMSMQNILHLSATRLFNCSPGLERPG